MPFYFLIVSPLLDLKASTHLLSEIDLMFMSFDKKGSFHLKISMTLCATNGTETDKLMDYI